MPSTARTTDVAALAFECGDRFVLRPVRDAQLAIARRMLAPARPLGGGAAERAHETAALATYGAVSAGLRLAGTGARALSRRGVGRPLDASWAGRRMRVVVNGLAGARLAELDDPHALAMTIRVRGRDVAPEQWRLREAFPDADGHLIVFVHDLLQDDGAWCRARGGYPEQLRQAGAGTPVLLRYNTGAPVVENGGRLADLLAVLCENWPTRVTRISLVGHAMGAVVVRAALNRATADGRHAWTGLVRDVICLGPPRLGAGLEKLARLGGALGAGRGPAALRCAVVSAERWEGAEITAAWGRERRAVAPLPHATHRFVMTEGAWDDRALLHHRELARLLVRWLSTGDRAPRALPTG